MGKSERLDSVKTNWNTNPAMAPTFVGVVVFQQVKPVISSIK